MTTPNDTICPKCGEDRAASLLCPPCPYDPPFFQPEQERAYRLPREEWLIQMVHGAWGLKMWRRVRELEADLAAARTALHPSPESRRAQPMRFNEVEKY